MRENPLRKARRAAIFARRLKQRMSAVNTSSTPPPTAASTYYHDRNNNNSRVEEPFPRTSALAALRLRSRALKARVVQTVRPEVMNTRWSAMPPRPCACGK